MFLIKLIALIAGMLSCSPLTQSCKEPITLLGGDNAKVTGTLIKRLEWGPPNFGESPSVDSKIEIWIVKLRSGVRVYVDSNSESGANLIIDEIQLENNPWKHSKESFLSLKDTRVSVTGKLWPATSASDYTQFVLAPTRLEKATDLDVKKCPVELLIDAERP